MNHYDIVFEKLAEVVEEETLDVQREVSVKELDEIDELRRFSAELQEPEPCSFTTT